ncbi:MAG: C-type lectin domain-containing protein [Kofleriaceae bacterium]
MLRPLFALALAASAAPAVLLAGCGVKIEGSEANPDAAISDARRSDPLPDAPPDARPCAGGDARVTAPDGSCLVLLVTPRTFADARTACAGLGGDLAIVRDAANDAAARTLAGIHNAWIGLTDQITEGTFLWVDGSAPTFTNWYTNEPNDGGGTYPEDCVILAELRGGKWDDRPCAPGTSGGGQYAAICQY